MSIPTHGEKDNTPSSSAEKESDRSGLRARNKNWEARSRLHCWATAHHGTVGPTNNAAHPPKARPHERQPWYSRDLSPY